MSDTIKVIPAPKHKGTYSVECKRYFIESLDKATKKTVSIPVTIRKMYVVDPCPITTSGCYRIVQRKVNQYSETVTVGPRGGRKTKREVISSEITYSLSALPRIPQSIWENPSGRAESWYKVGEEYSRKGMGPAMTEAEFLRWLSCLLGTVEATKALNALLTAEPVEGDEDMTEAA